MINDLISSCIHPLKYVLSYQCEMLSNALDTRDMEISEVQYSLMNSRVEVRGGCHSGQRAGPQST